MTPEQILASPRWDSDPIGLYDEIVEKMGTFEGPRVWTEACKLCDTQAADAELEQVKISRARKAEMVVKIETDHVQFMNDLMEEQGEGEYGGDGQLPLVSAIATTLAEGDIDTALDMLVGLQNWLAQDEKEAQS